MKHWGGKWFGRHLKSKGMFTKHELFKNVVEPDYPDLAPRRIVVDLLENESSLAGIRLMERQPGAALREGCRPARYSPVVLLYVTIQRVSTEAAGLFGSLCALGGNSGTPQCSGQQKWK